MSQNRDQQWSPVDAGKIFTVSMVLYALGVLTLGNFLLQTRGHWIMLAFALVSAPVAGLFVWESARQNREPICDDEPEEIEDMPP